MKDTKSLEDNIRTQYHEFYDLLNSGLCLIKTDANETILFANQKVAELYECESEEELLTYCDASYQHMMDADSYRSLNELAKYESLLKPIYQAITYEKDGTRYFSSKFDHRMVEEQLFHPGGHRSHPL